MTSTQSSSTGLPAKPASNGELEGSLDLFSTQSSLYAQFRIEYPKSFYDWLLPLVDCKDTAWDCATGNGQVASALAPHFKRVIATDLSQQQIDHAVQRPNIEYSIAKAESTSIPPHSIDLITVGQARHWFSTDAYHAEVRRVAKPNAVVCEFGYACCEIDEPKCDEIVRHFHFGEDRMGPYWDARRLHVDSELRELPFEFRDVQLKRFPVALKWTCERMLNYLRTWSCVAKYKETHDGADAVMLIAEELAKHWGAGERTVTFNIFVRAGRVN